MNSEIRKYNIIQKVMLLNESQLEKIEAVLQDEGELKASLEKAMKEVEEGKLTPHSDVRKKYEKWL